jgi:hypothetical protein
MAVMRPRLRPFVSIVILLGVLAAHDAMAAGIACSEVPAAGDAVEAVVVPNCPAGPAGRMLRWVRIRVGRDSSRAGTVGRVRRGIGDAHGAVQETPRTRSLAQSCTSPRPFL